MSRNPFVNQVFGVLKTAQRDSQIDPSGRNPFVNQVFGVAVVWIRENGYLVEKSVAIPS